MRPSVGDEDNHCCLEACYVAGAMLAALTHMTYFVCMTVRSVMILPESGTEA